MIQRLLSRAPFDSIELTILAALPCAILLVFASTLGFIFPLPEIKTVIIPLYFFCIFFYFGVYTRNGNPRGEEVFDYEWSSLHVPLWGALISALVIEASILLNGIDILLPRDDGVPLRALLGLTRCNLGEFCRLPVIALVSLMAVSYWGIPALGGFVWRYVLRTTAKERRFRAVCYGLFAHIARADGRVDGDEVALLSVFCREGLGLESSQAKRVVDAIRERPIGSFRELLLRCVAQNPPILREFILEILFMLAAADGRVGPEEEALLMEAAYRLASGADQIEELFVRYANRLPPSGGGQGEERERSRARGERGETRRDGAAADSLSPYAVLGVQPADSVETVKKRYRKLVKEFHPDILIGRGVPPEMIAQATRRFQKMQEAYEEIIKEKGG